MVTNRAYLCAAVLALAPAAGIADGKRCDDHPEIALFDEAAKNSQGLATYVRQQGRTAAPIADVGGEDCAGPFADPAHPVGALTYHGFQHCTGTLIAPTVVLTAAHCVKDYDYFAFKFQLGPDGTKPSRERAVVDASIHDDFDPKKAGIADVAVVYLETAIDGVTPMAFRRERFTDARGNSLIFIGYGNSATPQPGPKRCFTLPIESICVKTFAYGRADRRTCRGDSGGPALQRDGEQYRVVGVTSWGDSACAEYGVSMDIGAFLDFLRTRIEDAPTRAEAHRQETEVWRRMPAWPPALVENGDVVLGMGDAMHRGGRLVIPKHATIRFSADVDAIDWRFDGAEIGEGAVLDVSSPADLPGRAEDGSSSGGQPSWGVQGSNGRDGAAGKQGRAGRTLNLQVDGAPPKAGSLWIRTDGGPGQPGGYGGNGQIGGGSSCGKCLGFGPNEPHTNGGPGGKGGKGGAGGAGGDASLVTTNLPLFAPVTCGRSCAPSDRPKDWLANDGRILVWGAPGCGGPGGNPGNGGPGGDRWRSCPCGGDVFVGAPGTLGEPGNQGAPGICTKPVQLPSGVAQTR